MKKDKHVGIIGGTFNPIHLGHLILAEHAQEEFNLDEILFIPAGISYFKDPATVLDSKTRITMTGEAIQNNPHFALSTIETDRPGNSYTYETLEELKAKNPDTTYYLIIGADSLFQIELWKNPEIIFEKSVVLAAARKGQTTDELIARIDELNKKYKADIRLLPMPYIEISSTEIRDRIKAGKSIRYMVHPCTAEYISKNHLYEEQ